MSISIKIDADPSSEALVIERLRDFNGSRCAKAAERRNKLNDPYRLALIAYDTEGEIVGGVIADVWETFRWLHIDILWVAEDHRGQGLGTRLMDAIEEEAVRRGCTRAKLSTWDFQAPEFYKRRGYTVYGVLPDFPEGHTDYLLWKRLG